MLRPDVRSAADYTAQCILLQTCMIALRERIEDEDKGLHFAARALVRSKDRLAVLNASRTSGKWGLITLSISANIVVSGIMAEELVCLRMGIDQLILVCMSVEIVTACVSYKQVMAACINVILACDGGQTRLKSRQ